ncbi:MAG: hypothetical protein E6K80_13745 [Candidatus Eisenbacteria bacterium]|uniref:Uncharacterized protein n=1 Tax=Eiseniibacteriota bacterium TaxID=2212470 RepID=A0A538TYU6_UNCEI|nr:MAG: hypothetical protein E6K80_13745 [Candidatus Eisenbacteria bacterium]
MNRSHRTIPAAAALLAVAGLLATRAGHAGTHRHEHRFSSGYSDDRDRFSYAIVEPGGNTFSVMSDLEAWNESDDRIKNSRTPVFWFRMDGDAYLVRDREWVERAEDIRYQARLGARQGRLGAEQGALGARLAAISLRLSMRSRRGDDTGDLEREKEQIERRMETLSARQEELSRHHGPYSDRQSALGERQAALGERQRGAARKANQQLRDLAEDAIREGVAERIDR